VEAELSRDIPLRPGARELVTYLAEQSVPQAIATSSRRPTVERYLGRVGLRDRFAAIVSREDVKNPKPAPDPFLKAAARLGLAPGDCLALEDSYHGITAAHAAGMMTIMVPDLLAATDAVRAKCIAVADDLHVVGALLRKARVSSAASASS
jgi:HAD superfamily hydrolase (TIGR01509 family)